MQFDDILRAVGEFGRYQKRVFALLCMSGITGGSFMMANIVLLATPHHRCKLADYPNDTWEVQSTEHQRLINQSIPPSADYAYDRCHLYMTTGAMYDKHDRPLNASLHECQEWVYDRETFKETFTSKHNFVCGEAMKTSHAMLVFAFGVLVGDLTFGIISDIVGRQKTLTLSSGILIATTVGVAWSPNFLVFAMLEFVVGASVHGVMMSCVVLAMEFVGPSKRVWAGFVMNLFFTGGLCYLSLVSWLLRDWHYIEIAIAAPCVLYLLHWWLLPESPRWLLTIGRQEEANRILRRVAEVNGTTLPENIFDESTVTAEKGGKLWQLFTSRVLFTRTMIIFFGWMVVSMLYFGVTMYASEISGNFHLNFLFVALVEFPSYIIFAFLNTIGRTRAYMASMVLGGSACLGTIFTVIYGGEDLHALTLALTLIGKLGPSSAFAVIYLLSLEIFPTVLRNAGMGASSCVARFGSMGAPYIANLGDTIGGDLGKALPLSIFGVAGIGAGLLSLLLPETLRQKLPDTIEEAKVFKGYKRKRIAHTGTSELEMTANGYTSTNM